MAVDYTTQSEVEGHLGLSSGDLDNQFVDVLADSVKDFIHRFCGKKDGQDNVIFKRRFDGDDLSSETRYYDGNSLKTLEIDDYQQDSITSLIVDEDPIQDGDYFQYPANEDYGTRIELNQTTKPTNQNGLSIYDQDHYIFVEGQQVVEVTADFWYSNTPPKAIKAAATMLVSALVKDKLKGDVRAIDRESLGDYSVSYSKLTDLADRVGAKEFLMQYKRGSSKIAPKMKI